MTGNLPPTARPLSLFGLRHYQLHLSIRYLKSRFSALAALLSITFGVAVILILLAIMGGYVDALQELIRGQEAHLLVIGPTRYSVRRVSRVERAIRTVAGVEATAPYTETLAMYRSGGFSPCQLRGIDPRKQLETTRIGDYLLHRDELETINAILEDDSVESFEERSRAAGKRLDELLEAPGREPVRAEEFESFFSDATARSILERHPHIYEALEGEIPPRALVGAHLLLDGAVYLGQLLYVVSVDPRGGAHLTQQFVVSGAFKSGDFDADSKALYVHLDHLKNLLNLYDADANSFLYEGVRVRLRDDEELESARTSVQSALADNGFGDLRVFTWKQLRRNLLRAVEIEKFVNFFLLVLLLGFAVCMVLLMLTLTVIEKTRDIGVLLALGATPGGIVRIFLSNGLLLTLAGTVLGLSIGWTFCEFINPIHDFIFAKTGLQLFDPSVYNMDRIPVRIRIGEVILSTAPGLAFGFVASLVPAIWASRRDPIKAIHYE